MSGGGKGGGSNNSEVIDWEKQQASDAATKEAARQARLTAGAKQINDIFGGIGQDYYDKYTKSYMDYYQPQVEDQYNTAKKNLTYDLARAGQLRSSAAADTAAKLYKDKLNQDASIRSKADIATGDVRSNVAQQKTAAMQQLYATEDPSIAADTATHSVSNQLGLAPNYDPLGELFHTAAIGASGYLNANAARTGLYNSPGGGSGGMTSGAQSTTKAY